MKQPAAKCDPSENAWNCKKNVTSCGATGISTWYHDGMKTFLIAVSLVVASQAPCSYTAIPVGYHLKFERSRGSALGTNDYVFMSDRAGDYYTYPFGGSPAHTEFVIESGSVNKFKIRVSASFDHQSERKGSVQSFAIGTILIRSTTLPVTPKAISVDLQDWRSHDIEVSVANVGNDVAGGPLTFIAGAVSSSTGQWINLSWPITYPFPAKTYDYANAVDFGWTNVTEAFSLRTDEWDELPGAQDYAGIAQSESSKFTTTISPSEWTLENGLYVVKRHVPTNSVNLSTLAQVQPSNATFQVLQSAELVHEVRIADVTDEGSTLLPNECPNVDSGVRPIFNFWIYKLVGGTYQLAVKGISDVAAGEDIPLPTSQLSSGTYCIRLTSMGSCCREVGMTIASGVVSFTEVQDDYTFFGDCVPTRYINTDDYSFLDESFENSSISEFSSPTDWFVAGSEFESAPIFCDYERNGDITTDEYLTLSYNFDMAGSFCP